MPARERDFTAPTVQLLTPEGELRATPEAEAYLPLIEALDDATLQRFHRDMTVSRRLDVAGANLQRQGQLALWVPSLGQEAAQVGSAHAARPQDHIFPSYREHIVGMIRGLDPVRILALLRGATLGGWNPEETGNFHLYTLVLASQTLHSTGYAMGLQFDGATATGDPESDAAVLVYYGDGSTSQGDANEALVFASSYQTPQVFFIQNNQWVISVPVSRQSRSPLSLRGGGFGMPGIRVDGNDVLVSYAVTRQALEEARAGEGPTLIEALTYRMGAHT
ncbi:MAG TPA: thiamine pyrophosphate-dependent enzyme, partial [Microbacterium sp.]|nr:thiamine pyrophosphate-dependent enzyme [Microbacterium sp.]